MPSVLQYAHLFYKYVGKHYYSCILMKRGLVALARLRYGLAESCADGMGIEPLLQDMIEQVQP